MSEPFRWDIHNFDEAVEYAADMVGSQFKKAVYLAQEIAETPEQFTGPQAAMAAMKLAAYRTRISAAAQYWKMQYTQTKKPHDRLIKDSMLCMYDSLQELINCLKLVSRMEKDIIGS
jgi:hypothetical protein